MTKVLVVGHADADGHIIAEQVRRNLALIDSMDVQVVVDPERTRDHKAWTHLDSINEIGDADYVFFVDLMFGPMSYPAEAEALVGFVNKYPEKRFFLIDHHPLPLRRLSAADNLRVAYRPNVSECAIGPRSGMMVVAALCEREDHEVADVKTPTHETLAIGMRRAAALGGSLCGDKLLALLRADRWDELFALGKDDRKFHYLPRGRRTSGGPKSRLLKTLDTTAAELLADSDTGRHSGESQIGRTSMSYDADVGREQFSYDAGHRSLQKNSSPSPKDLGVIVTLLEVAALSLTTEPGATFSLERLIAEARKLAGKNLDLDERDIKIVLKKATFVEKIGKELRLK